MKRYAVITALNEADTIGQIVKTLKSDGFTVIVVNDGSADNTSVNAFLAGAWVIDHDKPYGIAASLLEAWRYALKDGADIVVQLDAGGSHNPARAAHLADSLIEFGADMVIGSRFARDGVYFGNPRRARASRLAARLMNWATRSQFTDWTSGYRAFTAQALRRLLEYNYYEPGHTWQIEVLTRARKIGLRIAEVGIVYQAGRSSFSLRTIDQAIGVFLWAVNLP